MLRDMIIAPLLFVIEMGILLPTPLFVTTWVKEC